MGTREMLSKILILLKLPLIYRNWPVRILGELGFDRSRYTYVLYNGVKLKGASEAPIVYDIWRKRVYNPKGFEIKSGDLIIDVGAHKGIFSVFAAIQSGQVKVLSYEPMPVNFKLLSENIKLNRLTDKIKAFNLAVNSKGGADTLFVRDGIKDSVSHSFHYRTRGDSAIEVQSTTLEEIFEENAIKRCNLLKLDCEGAEYQILTNASKELFKRVEKIALEYHPVEDFKVEVLRKFLEKSGFALEVKPPYLYAKRIP